MIDVNVALDCFSAAVMAIVLGICVSDRSSEKQQHLFFVYMLLSQLLLCFTDAFDWAVNGNLDWRIPLLISNTINYCMGYCIIWIFMKYLSCFLIIKQIERKRVSYFNNALCSVSLLLLIINLWTGQFFFIDETGVYCRGQMYWLSQALPMIGLLAASELIVFHTALSRTAKCYFMTYPLLPTIGILFDMFFPGYSLTYVGSTLSLLIIYTQFYIQRGKQLDQQRVELVQQQISVMLSQIQPHFLYNTLSAISELAHDTAPEVEKAILEFSEFLRGNLDSLNADKPISFEQELKHTEIYLALEKRRFGDRLKVQYDIQSKLFRLPALTLQPIVENAVRYGVTKREDGGTVQISTSETDISYVITVMDNGMGYDSEHFHSDGRTHIGIENVKKRLQMMCGGDLMIHTEMDHGTTAVLTIPKSEIKKEKEVMICRKSLQ